MAYNMKADNPLYTQPKKRWGDRRDAYLDRNQDPLHFFTPYLFPDRTRNEGYIQLTLDLTNANEYLKKKNEGNDGYQYKLFQLISMAFVKVLWLRPKMNTFIKRGRIYIHDNVSLAFNVKKQFTDEAHEVVVLKSFDRDTTLDTLHQDFDELINAAREIEDNQANSTDKAMYLLSKGPRIIGSTIAITCRFLDRYGKVPKSFVADDPYQASVLLSNVGSIGMEGGYHHLGEWGSNSVFVLIGQERPMPFLQEDGTFEVRQGVQIGLTIDERLADGFYYSKSIRLLKKLLENPELLELPAQQEIEY